MHAAVTVSGSSTVESSENHIVRGNKNFTPIVLFCVSSQYPRKSKGLAPMFSLGCWSHKQLAFD